MDYRTFMDKINLNINEMNKKEMVNLILELARLTKKNERVDFLDRFKMIDPKNTNNREEEIQKAYELIQNIENQEVYFECNWFESYGNDYWDRSSGYEYSDPEGLGGQLENVISLAEKLIYDRSYAEADKLYTHLLNLDYIAYEEASEEIVDLDLGEIINEKLVDISSKDICKYILYATYKSESGKNRVESIYYIFRNTLFANTTLEEMLSVGPEPLEDIDVFMHEFSSFLKNKVGDLESRLLKETMNFLDIKPVEFARNVASSHPAIYYDLCKKAMAMENYEEATFIGRDAIKNIPKELIIRSKIANLSAKSYKKLNDLESHRKYLLEAFISDSTCYNFLKLFTICTDEEIDDAYQFSKNVPVEEYTTYHYNQSGTAKNSITEFEQDIIRFLYGDLDYAKKKSALDREYLGWTSSYKGTIIPSFLVLLEKGCKASKARKRIVGFISRRIGGSTIDCEDDEFDTLIEKWKERINIQPRRDLYLDWIKDEVDKRVDAVVGGKYRKSYYKAAELIIYLGQMLESLDYKNETQNLVNKYKKAHSRKRAFKAEVDELW